MKKTIVTLIIVTAVTLIIAYRKPIGRFLSGDKEKKQSAADVLEKSIILTGKTAKAEPESVAEVEKVAAAAKENADPEVETKPEPEPEPEPDDDWFGGYDEDSRIVKAGGVLYNIPSVENMKSVQANLIEGFQFLADMAVTPSPFNPMTNPATELKDALTPDSRTFYRNLVEDMVEADTGNIPKTGIDGKMNRATAVAFAECVRIMPTVVAKYRIS